MHYLPSRRNSRAANSAAKIAKYASGSRQSSPRFKPQKCTQAAIAIGYTRAVDFLPAARAEFFDAPIGRSQSQRDEHNESGEAHRDEAAIKNILDHGRNIEPSIQNEINRKMGKERKRT